MSTARTTPRTGIILALSLAGFGLAGKAEAADYLRGAYGGEQQSAPASGPDWAGVYGGVHAGYSVGQTDPRALSGPLADAALPNSSITDLLRNTINLRESNRTGVSYGGFVGMNWLWDDVVLGIEADYTHSSIKANTTTGPYSLTRDVGTERWTVTSTSTSRAKLSDWATFRARVGWAAGMFMPYITAGLALGNVDSRATTFGTWTNTSLTVPPGHPPVNGSFSGVVGRRGITYGTAFGAGVDMQLLPGTFLRAEWQHIQLASGGQRPNISINTARVGGGVKF